nr:reverse transcriptase domain-containing protein [Tanacetum cinerariifolium]
MTLELADRSVSKPLGIAKDVSFKVGVFHFPADFVVVDFEPDPRVPLILGRCFLKTSRALIDVHKGEFTLRIRNEAITYNLDQTVRYSANYNQMTANRIDFVCEEYSQEVLGFSDTTVSGNPTPIDDPIVSTTSPALTPFGDSDFLLFEEADAFLGLEDDPDSPKINPFYYDPEGDILLLEAILNSEPLPPLLNHEQYLPSYKKELKVCEAKTVKSSVDEPPEVELKDLPHHLEYAFLEGDDKLPVIIAKELRSEEKAALIKVLKSHKRAIAWKLSDIKGINPEFCTHKILMEEDYKPAVQHQRRVNPKIHDVIKKEVEKLLDAGLIYPISDSPWVSPFDPSYALGTTKNKPEDLQELFRELSNDVQNIHEELAEYINTPGWNRPAFYDDDDYDDVDYTIAITPNETDSDSFMEEIDLFLTPDDPMPPSIEDDEDSEWDILFLERLLHDDPIPLPDTLDVDFSYEVRTFLPFFTYPVTSPVLLSSGSEDKIFEPGITVDRSYSF